MKKFFKAFSIVLLFTLIIYIISWLCVSTSVYQVADDAILNVPYNHANIIDKTNYDYMNPKQPECEDKYESIKTESSHTFPLLIPFTNTVYYKYSYLVSDDVTKEDIYGSLDSGVLLKVGIKDFKIYIYDVENLVAPLWVEIFQ